MSAAQPGNVVIKPGAGLSGGNVNFTASNGGKGDPLLGQPDHTDGGEIKFFIEDRERLGLTPTSFVVDGRAIDDPTVCAQFREWLAVARREPGKAAAGEGRITFTSEPDGREMFSIDAVGFFVDGQQVAHDHEVHTGFRVWLRHARKTSNLGED